MDIDDFWVFLERSGRETDDQLRRDQWLEERLCRVSREHIADFQIHVDTLRRPLDTYALWGAASLMLGGWCGSDSFWYFQPWVIGQGRRWYEHVALGADNLADLPAVRALAGRPRGEWDKAEWPGWETLAYVAWRAHDFLTGEEDSLDAVLRARGQRRPSSPAPTDRPWRFDDPAELRRRLPRLTRLFPPERLLKD
ncbi:MAG TPA: DUF4240 domain-containing protein [Trebonia sp.]|nr:DUF4240 domain-containing protein [Trebonia sp.]